MIRRYCSVCKKRFNPIIGSEWQCPSCRAFNEYRVSHPHQERRNLPDETHFAFYPSYTNKLLEDSCKNKVMGNCERDKKDSYHYSVTINLFNFTQENPIDDIIKSISHEYLHVSIALASDWETSKKADSNLLKRLEREGYLGGN